MLNINIDETLDIQQNYSKVLEEIHNSKIELKKNDDPNSIYNINNINNPQELDITNTKSYILRNKSFSYNNASLGKGEEDFSIKNKSFTNVINTDYLKKNSLPKQSNIEATNINSTGMYQININTKNNSNNETNEKLNINSVDNEELESPVDINNQNKEIKEKMEVEDTNDYLLITDFPSSQEESKEVELQYQTIIINVIEEKNQENLKQSLDKINLKEKNPKKDSVKELSLIERMVEETYNNDSSFKYDIAEQICYLTLISYKWRQIKGDGNCFYRSIMFRYLECLVLENDILSLKNIVVNLNKWFSSNYLRTDILPNTIRKSFVEMDVKLLINVFHFIIKALKANKVKEAYSILIKCFLYSSTFDIGMVLYLRYSIYDFLSDNDNFSKYFSKEFPVLLGNLLPIQYETEDGKFNFEEFFTNELLKLYTYAEKIVIYVTPFVIKRSIKLLIYDFGKECNIQTKEFNCFLNNGKEVLEILYRKCHYDAVYSKEFCLKYIDFLNIFALENEKLKVVSNDLIEYYRQNDILDVDLQQSKIFDKKQKLMEKENKNSNVMNADKFSKNATNTKNTGSLSARSNNNKDVSTSPFSSNYYNSESNVSIKKELNKEMKLKEQINDQQNSHVNNEAKDISLKNKEIICGLCNTSFNNSISNHKLYCDKCLSTYFLKHINNTYSQYDLSRLQSKSNAISVDNIRGLCKYFCSNCGISFKKLKDNKDKTKTNILKSYENPFKCGCSFCSENCFKVFLEHFKDQICYFNNPDNQSIITSTYVCKCREKVGLESLIKICNNMPNLCFSLQDKIQKTIISKVKLNCMFCGKYNDKNLHQFKEVLVDDLFNIFNNNTNSSNNNKLIHVICSDCCNIPFYLLDCINCKALHYNNSNNSNIK